MLVDFLPSVLRRNERAILFPFLSGLARHEGVRTQWLRFGGVLETDARPATGLAIRAVLPEPDLRRFAELLARLRPTHVVFADMVSDSVLRLLEDSSPRPDCMVMRTIGETQPAQRGPGWAVLESRPANVSTDPAQRGYAARCAWLLDWLGVRDTALEGRLLVEAVDPDYRAVLANPGAAKAPALVTVVSGAICGHRRSLRDNPFYSGLGPPHEDHLGCAFCETSSTVPFSPPGKSLLAITARQFRAILGPKGPRGPGKGFYDLYDIEAFRRFDEVAGMLLRLKAPPSVFFFNPRIDDVLASAKRIEAVLPALAKAGHEIRIMSMGIENFSEQENERLNKGIVTAQVDALIALTRRWGKAFPGVFRALRGGDSLPDFGLILYTPWTTLADLRINLSAAVDRGFPTTGFWLYSTLLIYPGSPLEELARREGGVLTRRLKDSGMIYGSFQNGEEVVGSLPWSFKDNRVADFFAVAVRICAAAAEGRASVFFKDDSEFHALKDIFLDAAETSGATPLAAACSLLEVLEGTRPPRTRPAMLREAVLRLRTAGPVAGGGAGEAFASLGTPASAAAQAAWEAFRSLRRRRSGEFADVRLDDAAECVVPAGKALHIAFSVAGHDLVFKLFGSEKPGPCFLKSRRLKAVLSPATPDCDGRARQVSQLIIDEIDRALGPGFPNPLDRAPQRAGSTVRPSRRRRSKTAQK
jgi:hypothetical protein